MPRLHPKGELHDAIAQGRASVVEHFGDISGYSTDIGWGDHAIGQTNEDLEALIAAAPAFHAPGFLVPTRNGELMRWCLDRGLRIATVWVIKCVIGRRTGGARCSNAISGSPLSKPSKSAAGAV